eukprot:m.715236 g.715236  ORF g.715236 m.715236 type:complete len:75 (+) comp22978_c0_seq9:2585-2809(+)
MMFVPFGHTAQRCDQHTDVSIDSRFRQTDRACRIKGEGRARFSFFKEEMCVMPRRKNGAFLDRLLGNIFLYEHN